MYEIIDITELIYGHRREDEGIEIWLAHGSINAIRRERKWEPSINQRGNALRPIGVEIDLSCQSRFIADLWFDTDTEGIRCLQCVDNVEIMSEGFSEILPRVRRGVGADKTVPPLRRYPFRIVPLKSGVIVLPVVTKCGAAALQMALVQTAEAEHIPRELTFCGSELGC